MGQGKETWAEWEKENKENNGEFNAIKRCKDMIDKRVYENMYVFTVVLIVKTKHRLSECTVVNVSVLTTSHSHS